LLASIPASQVEMTIGPFLKPVIGSEADNFFPSIPTTELKADKAMNFLRLIIVKSLSSKLKDIPES
jgi:hypothetical protein